MATNFDYRKKAIESLPKCTGVYVLCDLDETPIYVGQSTNVGQRVSRHTTSARSDIIANRQIDVWEIAHVWIYPTATLEEAKDLEGRLFHQFNETSPLFNGSLPKARGEGAVPEPAAKVQIMPDEEIAEKQDANQRLPRQAEHYAQIVDHFLSVKNSEQVKRAMDAHFKRLTKYHASLQGIAGDEDEVDESGE